MVFYIEQVGLGELCVHSSRYCDGIKSQGSLTEKEVPTYEVGQAARVVQREAGLATVRQCGVCGGGYRPSYGGGGYSHGGIEEEEPLQA